MQRAIPPDLSRADSLAPNSVRQHEAIGDLHLAADQFAGAVEAYSAALAELGGEPRSERGRLLLRLADASIRRSDLDLALTALNEARGIARQSGDLALSARASAFFVMVHLERGNYRRARRYGLFAYRVLRGSDDHRTVGHVELHLGVCAEMLGRRPEAIEWLQNAAATFRRIDDVEGLVCALNELGIVYKNMREWREATRFLEQALRLDERAGLYERMRTHNQNLGLIRYRLGQWDLAEENFRQSLRIARETGHQVGEAIALLAFGMLYRRRRQLGRAAEHYRSALEIAAPLGAWREVALAREFLAEIELDRGNGAGAMALLEPALEDANARAPEGDMAMELSIRVGMAHLASGRAEPAQRYLLAGLALAEQLGDRIESAIAERALGRLEATRGNAAAFETRIRSAASCFEQLGETYELALTLATWAEGAFLLPTSTRLKLLLEPVGDAARRAATLFRQLGIPSLAAECYLNLSRLESEREHFDFALGLLEQAESWLAESEDPDVAERAEALRRDLERQYVAVSLSTCNEFRALEDANRLFRETADMDGLLNQAVRLAVEHAGGDRGFVAFTNGGARLDVVAQHGLGRERARRILRVLEQVGGSRLAENGPLFSSRVTADPRFSVSVVDALDGVGSLVCVPLNFPSQSVGLVYVDRLNDSLLGAFKQRELNLLAVLANSAAVAIVEAQRSRLLEENRQLRDRLKPSPGMERVVSQSREIQSILQLLQKVSDSPATVLFMGETGTGKGLLAQVVHESSARRDRPFIQVNCAAIPEHLLESELFGYVQGAFTGAMRDKTGLFEEAEGGTLFLDEIEKIPETVQAKLLHVLDRSEIRPVGAARSRRVDTRVICATGCDLRDRIRERRFLEDLYYRLNDITVRVPPLRERREDIPLLAQYFLTSFSRQMDRSIAGFSAPVMQALLEHTWPGNVRELEKTVKRMVVLADDGATLDVDLLPPDLRESTRPASTELRVVSRTLKSNVVNLERQLIAEALERTRWNKTRAARELGLSYPTLLAKIRSFQLERQRGG